MSGAVVLAALLLACSKPPEQKSASSTTTAPGPSAAERERAKALAEPFANDYGPESLPKAVLAGYPKEAQAGYRLMIQKCTVCHTASRPLNSQFVETAGRKKADREASLARLKKSSPDLFKDKLIWQVESDIWRRYVKRMMNKPGCEVTKDESRTIWAFFAHDSLARKLGKNTAVWKAHRQKLLARIKKEHPERYKALYSRH